MGKCVLSRGERYALVGANMAVRLFPHGLVRRRVRDNLGDSGRVPKEEVRCFDR
jgi:hypothetical protein